MLAAAYCFLSLKEKEKENNITVQKLSALLGQEYTEEEIEEFLNFIQKRHNRAQRLLKDVVFSCKEMMQVPRSSVLGFTCPDTDAELKGKLRELHAEINGNLVFRVYETPGVTLFSLVDGHPILTLDLKTKGQGHVVFSNEISNEISKRILVDQDNQEIVPVVTNHTPYYLNFGIAERGSNINEINVLPPYEQYEIPADQRTGRSIILSSILSKQGNRITVAEDEKKKPSEREGLYWKVTVQTESPPRWKESKETIWRCVPFVLHKRPVKDPDFPDDEKDDSEGEEEEEKDRGEQEQNMDRNCNLEAHKEEESDIGMDDMDDDDEDVVLSEEEYTVSLPPDSENIPQSMVGTSHTACMKPGKSVVVNSKRCDKDFHTPVSQTCSLSLSVQPKLQLLKDQVAYKASWETGVVHADWKDRLFLLLFHLLITLFNYCLRNSIYTLSKLDLFLF